MYTHVGQQMARRYNSESSRADQNIPPGLASSGRDRTLLPADICGAGKMCDYCAGGEAGDRVPIPVEMVRPARSAQAAGLTLIINAQITIYSNTMRSANNVRHACGKLCSDVTWSRYSAVTRCAIEKVIRPIRTAFRNGAKARRISRL